MGITISKVAECISVVRSGVEHELFGTTHLLSGASHYILQQMG
jgi:hypothetical protein